MFSSAQGSLKASCNGKRLLREVEVSHKQTARRTYMHAQTIAPSWFDVSCSESHFYLRSQISINTGLDCFEKNSSWPCSHSSLWASQGLVNRLHKFPLSILSAAPSHNKQPLSFIRNTTEKPPQLYSRPANFTFQSTNLTAWFNTWEGFWNCFYQTVHNTQRAFLFCILIV